MDSSAHVPLANDRISINQVHLNSDNVALNLHISWQSLSFTSGAFRKEAKALMALALPMGFSLATRILQYLTDQSMVGHLGTDFLAASSMANVLMTISGTYCISDKLHVHFGFTVRVKLMSL